MKAKINFINHFKENEEFFEDVKQYESILIEWPFSVLPKDMDYVSGDVLDYIYNTDYFSNLYSYEYEASWFEISENKELYILIFLKCC